VPWVVVGIGGAGIAAGGVIGLLASQRNLDAKGEPTYTRADTLHSQAQSYAKVANICFIAGGVVLVGGIVWGLLDVAAARRQRRSALSPLATFTF
jgi:hypothetical protein